MSKSGLTNQTDLCYNTIMVGKPVNLHCLADQLDPDNLYIDMYDVYQLGNYKVPFSRWAKKGLVAFGVRGQKLFKKDNPTGRPRIHYYVMLDDAREWLEAISRRRHLQFNFVLGEDNAINDNG